MEFKEYRSIENSYRERFLKKMLYEGKSGGRFVVEEKVHGCLHENTKIMLANGEEREIKNIKEGDVVLSYNEKSFEFEPSIVEKVVKRSKEGIWMKLQIDDKVIICTDNHPLLTTQGYIKAKDLTENNDIISVY